MRSCYKLGVPFGILFIIKEDTFIFLFFILYIIVFVFITYRMILFYILFCTLHITLEYVLLSIYLEGIRYGCMGYIFCTTWWYCSFLRTRRELRYRGSLLISFRRCLVHFSFLPVQYYLFILVLFLICSCSLD